MNAVAGGGSFVTFPVLVLVGLPPIAANATSTVALFPGTLASTWAYRDDLRGIGGIGLKVLLPISLAGGLAGAILLLVTPGGVFDVVIPWLLLLATLTFAGGRRLGDWLRRHVRIGRPAFLVDPVHPVDLWRLFRRRGRADDDGGLDAAGFGGTEGDGGDPDACWSAPPTGRRWCVSPWPARCGGRRRWR